MNARDNQLLTRTGPETPMGRLLRRYWIPALCSRKLAEPDCPAVRVKLLGERLVAVRGTDGTVALLGEHCPHRRASLFFGRNEEQGLRCVYHGWKFGLDGRCLETPGEPNPNFKNKIAVAAYPAREQGGIVWTYMGPRDHEPELPQLEWTLVPESHRFVTKRLQESNWFQALEGGYDLKALADSGREVIEELGRADDEPIAPAADGVRVIPVVERAQYFHDQFWKFS